MDRRLFSDEPDGYKIQSIASSRPVISQATYCMLLRKVRPDFCDITDTEQNLNVMREMALDFVFSADGLAQYYDSRIQPHYDSNGRFCGNSFNPRCPLPISYLCRHAIELFLKYIWMVEYGQNCSLPSHNLLDLWQSLNLDGVSDEDELTGFISELDTYDPMGMNLRYGFNRKFEPVSLDAYMFDVGLLLQNTKHLFNVMYPWILKVVEVNCHENQIGGDPGS